ncbi:MAG: HAD-IA family hydrolase [Gammaproteobacteria bacterium]|nr:HAD-IA family hydrolase [Gammaproteobacteria bacterium]
MSNTLQGVLFDKDGTLLDFHRTWAGANEQAAEVVAAGSGQAVTAARLLQAGGYDPVSNSYRADAPLACGTTADIAAVWAPLLDGVDAGPLAQELERIFQALVGRSPCPVEGLHETLDALSERGFKQGLATMDSAAMAALHLDELKLAHYFDFVCGHDSGLGNKPDPGMVFAFCEAVALTPAQVVMVGDTPYDLMMGRAAGAGFVIAVLSGAGTRDALAPLADWVLPSIASLPAWLARHG